MIKYKNGTYEVSTVDGLIAVNLWFGEDTETPPVIYQPHSPDTGLAWESEQEAENWIINFLDEDEYSRNNPPTPEQVLNQKLAQIGLSVDELKYALGLQ